MPVKKSFVKYDKGKLEYDILPNEVCEAIIKVLMYGQYVKGYDRFNWRNCPDLTRFYNASRRHMEAYRKGEYYDPESKLPHLVHNLANVIFMYLNEEEKRGQLKTSKTGAASARTKRRRNT